MAVDRVPRWRIWLVALALLVLWSSEPSNGVGIPGLPELR